MEAQKHGAVALRKARQPGTAHLKSPLAQAADVGAGAFAAMCSSQSGSSREACLL